MFTNARPIELLLVVLCACCLLIQSGQAVGTLMRRDAPRRCTQQVVRIPGANGRWVF